MGGASRVVTWEDGRELDDSIIVCLLDAAQGRVVQVAGVVAVAVLVGLDARVDTGRVGAPDVSPWETPVSVILFIKRRA